MRHGLSLRANRIMPQSAGFVKKFFCIFENIFFAFPALSAKTGVIWKNSGIIPGKHASIPGNTRLLCRKCPFVP